MEEDEIDVYELFGLDRKEFVWVIEGEFGWFEKITDKKND